MDSLSQLPQLEALCERLYNAQDPTERKHAESVLVVFSSSQEYATQCKAILDSSSSPYAQLLASSSLLKIVTEQGVTKALLLDIRNYVLGYLANRGPNCQVFVITQLIQLLSRTTKLGWFEDDAHRGIVTDAKKFLGMNSLDHHLLGLRVLNQLVAEMNQPLPGRSLTQHRKCAVSFRDLGLLPIFQTALSSLREFGSMETESGVRIKEQAIVLALKCLCFDFVGTSLDESNEDLGTIQVPSAWRPVMEEPNTMKLFFDIYGSTQPPLSNQAIECIVRFACVRRSLFASETERNKYLTNLINGTREILMTQKGLGEHANYHEFCRLLGRLKTNYQLSELVGVENYSDWIQRVADFTVKSLMSWQWASNSVYYILGLWSRLVSSMPYLRGDKPSLLDNYVPKITEAYITSRLDSVQLVLQNPSVEDMLENEEQLQEQFDCLPFLCRFQYEDLSKYLCSLTDPLVKGFTECGNLTAGADIGRLLVLEGQLTWIVYIIGAVIKGRLNSSSAESQESIDGDLAVRVFALLRVMDTGYHTQRYGARSRQRLDKALLSFFQNFRRVYVGEQAIHSSKVYTPLKEHVGIPDHLTALDIIANKIATNLKIFPECEELVDLTLTLFQDLAAGYMSGKLLLKLNTINYILGHHTHEYFPFLDEPLNTRHRTTFYATLGRLLFMDDSPSKFKAFVAPFQQVFAMIESQADDINRFRSQQVTPSLIGLFRDLRGITMATNSRRNYAMLFDWLYPDHMPLIRRTLETYTDTPSVTTPLLKFFAEFVLNKTQRLAFEASSPNGIKLFWETSKIIVAHGTRLLQLGNVQDVYTQKYKGAALCFMILLRGLAGNYVNFGVFELYGDPSLNDALDVTLKLALSIPLNHLMAYQKVARAYFQLIEVLTHNHTAFLVSRDSATFLHVGTSLETGLKSLDVSISSQCAAAVDSLAAFYFNNVVNGEGSQTQASQSFVSHIQENPQIFPSILKTLFEIVLFEDCSNQWSLSRPMLSLILLNEQVYTDLKMQIIASQPTEKQQKLASCFGKLMDNIARTLESKNRDKFTQNLTIFRHDFRAKK
jgi:exportin-7